MVLWQKGSFNHIQMPGSQQFQDAFDITIDAASCFCSCCMYSMAKRNTATAKVLPQRCSIVTYQCSTQMRTPWYERNACMLSYCMMHTYMYVNIFRTLEQVEGQKHCNIVEGIIPICKPSYQAHERYCTDLTQRSWNAASCMQYLTLMQGSTVL